jgi:hydroxyacyl-ACP dehydratase HTD2-like protein with hotdog domain
MTTTRVPAAVGDVLPELVREPTDVQLFAFSAATWNSHRIHYDREYTREQEGYPDILVQAHLHACFLTQAVMAAYGDGARVVLIGWQNRGIAVPGDRLVISGTVTEVGDAAGRTRVDLALEERNGAGALCVKGWATVELPEEDV